MPQLTKNPIFDRRPEAAQEELHDRTAFTAKAKKRQMISALQSANAIRDLQALPGPEESTHIIARGNFPLWQIVPAVLTMAAPAIIDALHIATLGFSQVECRGPHRPDWTPARSRMYTSWRSCIFSAPKPGGMANDGGRSAGPAPEDRCASGARQSHRHEAVRRPRDHC